LHKKEEYFSRKGAKRYRVSQEPSLRLGATAFLTGFLCVFAPLRENLFRSILHQQKNQASS
jgi:hypothetical protein